MAIRSRDVTECPTTRWMQAVKDLQRLFELVGAYGFREWLVFDASIIRGLAYYTGKILGYFNCLSFSFLGDMPLCESSKARRQYVVPLPR